MKEHGLIRTGEMVRAFLDGRKTQTRIRIKRLPIHADYGEPRWDRAWLDESWDLPCLKVPYVGGPMGETTQRHFCRYAVGDVVYIRETWAKTDQRERGPFAYRANNVWPEIYRWKPSIHMPKWAARLWYPILQIKDPERPADISEADAIAEGVECEAREATDSFLTLWQSLYGRTDEWMWPLVLGERIVK